MMKRNRKNNLGRILAIAVCMFWMALPAKAAGTQDGISYADSKESGVHFSQSSAYLNQVIEVDMTGKTRLQLLKTIARKAGMKISYDAALSGLDDKVSLKEKTISVRDALWETLSGTNIRFAVSNSGQLALFPMASTNADAGVQTGSVSGVIIDGETGDPMPDANVFLEGTTKGTSTNANGAFLLEDVEVGTHTLIATFVGYERAEREITVREGEVTNVNFTLRYMPEEFEELVVIGYGSTRKQDLTGSVSTIDSEDIEDLSPTVNVDQALQGKAAGVYVVNDSGQPGSAAKVRIRGSTSLLGSNQPLYVIDGIPVVAESNIPDDGTPFNTELLQQGLNSPLGNINPNDIESISVLKDASAAAIYGSRAANGVIIINTKRGSERGGTQYNANYSMTTSEARTTDVLNAEQFREIYTEAVENSSVSNSFTQSVLDGSYFGDANTNWEEEVSRGNPVTQNFNFSAGGGNEQLAYFTSVGVMNQDGVFEKSSLDRYSLNLKLDAQLSDRLNIGSYVNLSSTTQMAPDGGLLDRIYDFRPDVPVFDDNGDYSVSGTYALENPVALSQASIENKTTQFMGTLFGRFDITENLLFESSLSMTYNKGDLKSVYPSVTFKGGFSRFSGPGTGFAKQGTSTYTSPLWENTLTYRKFIGDYHNVKAMLGASWSSDRNEYLQASGEGFPKDEILTNLSSASENFEISSSASQSGLESYFGRVEYGYDNRYLLTLTGRVDRSSKFAEENQWAFFPTIAGAWRISSEPFFSGIDFIDDLKLRASTGVAGQQDFGAYQWRTLFTADQYGGDAGVTKTQLGNSKLKWEVTKQLDVGLDFIMLDGRLSGGVGYYEKNTEDLLYFFKTPGNTGFSQVISNLGDTQNRGFEVYLSGDIIQSREFTWNLSANISRNKNKLVKLNDDFLDADRGVINPPNTGSVLQVGKPLGLLYGYVSDGVFQSQAEIDDLNATAPGGVYQDSETAPGDLKFEDLDGDGEITSADQAIIGDSQPDFTGGFTSTFNYKGFSLSALFTFSVGNDLRWGYQAAGINFGSTFLSENKSTDVMNRWTSENPTNQPRAVYLDPNNNDRISSYYVHDASYLRLSNLNLTYELPQNIKPDFLRSLSVYATARNLLTITGYPGADPETNNLFNDDVSSGLDNSRYPTPKVYTLGINIGF